MNCRFVDINYQSVQTTEGFAKVPTTRMKRALESHRSSLITCIASVNACQFSSDLSKTFAILELVYRNVAYSQDGRSSLPTVLYSPMPCCSDLSGSWILTMLPYAMCSVINHHHCVSSSSRGFSMAESLGRLTDRSINQFCRAYVTRMRDGITI